LNYLLSGSAGLVNEAEGHLALVASTKKKREKPKGENIHEEVDKFRLHEGSLGEEATTRSYGLKSSGRLFIHEYTSLKTVYDVHNAHKHTKQHATGTNLGETIILKTL
jgi:hypothetical protein